MEAKEWQMETSVFFIRATHFEKMTLWEDYHLDIGWTPDNLGFLETVGHLNIGGEKYPVNVAFSFDTIHGQRVCFYDVISRYSDSVMVEEYIEKNYPVTWSNGTRKAMVDASNFHLALDHCKQLLAIQMEPLLVLYENFNYKHFKPFYKTFYMYPDIYKREEV